MTGTAPGAAPVGRLSDLDPVGQQAITLLRRWPGGGEAGTDQALARLLRIIGQHARRPMMRHGPDCQCLGGDEAAFALLLEHAGSGEDTNAALIAVWLVRPAAVPDLVTAARALARSLAAATLH